MTGLRLSSTRKRHRFFLISLVVLLLVYIGLYSSVIKNLKDLSPFQHNLKGGKHVFTPFGAAEIRRYEIQNRDRIAKISETCSKLNELKDLKGYKNHKPVYYVATRYNWSYCKIGKIGSTLMTQFFYVLHHDGENTKKVLNKNREIIHRIENRGLRRGVDRSEYTTNRMIVSARNPYTRLFSAYIDRMYIPSTSISVRGSFDHKCKSQITFSEFLEFVIKNTRNASGVLDYHWAPVFYLCKPCDVDPQFLITQETLKTDFLYLLNKTDLELYKHDVLHDVMRLASNWTGYSLVDDVLDFIMSSNHRHATDCQSYEQVSKRLWEALKIQGFISEVAPFPRKRYKSEEDYKNSDIFRVALRDVRKKYPLSKAGVTLQRQNAMNKFYKSVRPDIIEGIKEVYAVDFEMFGYSYDPPPW